MIKETRATAAMFEWQKHQQADHTGKNPPSVRTCSECRKMREAYWKLWEEEHGEEGA